MGPPFLPLKVVFLTVKISGIIDIFWTVNPNHGGGPPEGGPPPWLPRGPQARAHPPGPPPPRAPGKPPRRRGRAPGAGQNRTQRGGHHRRATNRQTGGTPTPGAEERGGGQGEGPAPAGRTNSTTEPPGAPRSPQESHDRRGRGTGTREGTTGPGAPHKAARAAQSQERAPRRAGRPHGRECARALWHNGRAKHARPAYRRPPTQRSAGGNRGRSGGRPQGAPPDGTGPPARTSTCTTAAATPACRRGHPAANTTRSHHGAGGGGAALLLMVACCVPIKPWWPGPDRKHWQAQRQGR